MTKTKQVIVIRKDLNMRKGKMCSQAAHASLAVFTKTQYFNGKNNMLVLNGVSSLWMKDSFRKIVVGVDSEEELKRIYTDAQSLGLLCSLIKDNGDTEFNGVPTYTAVAIGPDFNSKIDPLTRNLKLL